ncbi:hypothetical protein F2Q70_00016343 [Brassica cretica]|uniref:F-box/LRR-repeat protein 15/At3g58940/PEG3-like LRR domain-containing protein n=1 Tax=Brassica cretica TaxID=69181 RepID=A0A8S9I438_BRACR|nr:hypothetical protein F2Q70_00016343 [Brassica cretica]KAF2599031.1 hypothetical protein F2Q68_00009312 [Brassica cretica]
MVGGEFCRISGPRMSLRPACYLPDGEPSGGPSRISIWTVAILVATTTLPKTTPAVPTSNGGSTRLSTGEFNVSTFVSEDAFVSQHMREKLISGCPVLESLTLDKISSDYGNPIVLRVYSPSLLSFTLPGSSADYDEAVAVDAPRLECLRIRNHNAAESFIMNRLVSPLVTLNVDTLNSRIKMIKPVGI